MIFLDVLNLQVFEFFFLQYLLCEVNRLDSLLQKSKINIYNEISEMSLFFLKCKIL